MKKVIKITESQYKRIFLLNEQKPDNLMPFQPDYGLRPGYTADELVANAKKQHAAAVSIGKVIYDVFDCSRLRGNSDWLAYGHCIVDNISMAVSVVPVIGTAASAIADLLNSVVYMGEAHFHNLKGGYLSLTGDHEGAKKEFIEGGMDAGLAGLSALGIIPGVTEAKALGKISKGVMKNTDNILKELSEQGIKKGSKKAEDIKKVNQVIEKYSKGMSTSEKKQMGELLDLLGNPKVKEEIKNMGKFNDFTQNFMKSTGLKNYQLRALIGDKNFTKILKNNGGDIYKALNSNETKKLISNIIAQGVSVVAMVGFNKWIETYLKTKPKSVQEKFLSLIEDPEKLQELKKLSENETLSLIDSIEDNPQMTDDEFWAMADDIEITSHLVSDDENIATIAKEYGMKWTELYDLNKDIIAKMQKEYGGLKTCDKSYCKGRETPSPNHLYKGTILKIK